MQLNLPYTPPAHYLNWELKSIKKAKQATRYLHGHFNANIASLNYPWTS